MRLLLGEPKLQHVAVRQHYEGALVPALRHVGGVRIVMEQRGTRCEVYGIGDRHPAVVPVSLALAARLVAAGAPLTIHDGRPMDTPVGLWS